MGKFRKYVRKLLTSNFLVLLLKLSEKDCSYCSKKYSSTPLPLTALPQLYLQIETGNLFIYYLIYYTHSTIQFYQIFKFPVFFPKFLNSLCFPVWNYFTPFPCFPSEVGILIVQQMRMYADLGAAVQFLRRRLWKSNHDSIT